MIVLGIDHGKMGGDDALTVTIPGEPHAQKRAKFRVLSTPDGARPIVSTYDPKDSRSWKADARSAYVAALRQQAGFIGETGLLQAFAPDGPVRLHVLAVFTCPKGDARKREPRPRRRHAKKPDADNVLKAVKDAGTGVLWLDDSQVAEVTVEKWIGAQGEAPHVVVTVSRIQETAA